MEPSDAAVTKKDGAWITRRGLGLWVYLLSVQAEAIKAHRMIRRINIGEEQRSILRSSNDAQTDPVCCIQIIIGLDCIARSRQPCAAKLYLPIGQRIDGPDLRGRGQSNLRQHHIVVAL